jgi:hypothetical protein
MRAINTTRHQSKEILKTIKTVFKPVLSTQTVELREAEAFLNRLGTESIIDIELYVMDGDEEIRVVLSITDEIRWVHHFNTQGDLDLVAEKIISIILSKADEIKQLTF